MPLWWLKGQFTLRFAILGIAPKSSFFSGVTLAILIGGLIFAAQEYTRQESQVSFEIYKSIHAKLTDPNDEAARRWIIQNIKPFNEEEMSKDEWIKKASEKIHKKTITENENLAPGHESLKRVLNTFDYFGFVAENHINVEGALLEWMSAPIAKVWERIKPYVENERDKRKEPDFYKSAFYIGEKCLEWRINKGLKSEIIDSGI